MSYSAKIGDINGFDLDIIAMGSRRRARAESEKKALVNSEKYSEPAPRVLNGGMDTNDKLKAVAAARIEEMYSAPVKQLKSRAVPTAPSNTSVRNDIVTKINTVQHANATKTRTIPVAHAKSDTGVYVSNVRPNKATAEIHRETLNVQNMSDNSAKPTVRKRSKVYTAKRRTSPGGIITKKRKDKNALPIGAVSAILIITVMLLYFVVLYIQKFELQESINDMNNMISEKNMTLNTWETKLDDKNPSLDKIEQFAAEEGMVRKTPDKYISVTPEEDIIEIYGNQ
ncbi:MAG: hypothetical protein E7588_03045 [Ruminococcaceae bacterium]|nr:hypothetical protein [Oscillospiraceae bacterium]